MLSSVCSLGKGSQSTCMCSQVPCKQERSQLLPAKHIEGSVCRTGCTGGAVAGEGEKTQLMTV